MGLHFDERLGVIEVALHDLNTPSGKSYIGKDCTCQRGVPEENILSREIRRAA
jgi:hypothetical protein